ncbi:hypothetical protein L596_015001 [Steinernema carpocapsae]|uniref:25S rRNA (uridine-N(3))-methyltransferase BMT5-like domain-containing protein n=1 Tax=Steinernema carpocapsae TaxID=34508 RepID=A0A4U5NEL4_STECR|nr:hypothetical protein L596_015001 [Steinernema carpocapsae]
MIDSEIKAENQVSDEPPRKRRQTDEAEIINRPKKVLTAMFHKTADPCVQARHLIASESLPYKGPSVLIMGDGNLSFSCAFARMFPKFNIVASVVESKEEFKERYPSGSESLEELSSLPNVAVNFGVDATKLPEEWRGRFQDIIMNFPHPGGKTNLKRSKELISGVFSSLQGIMTPNCRFHLTLAKRQSGLNHSAVKEQRSRCTEAPEHEKDSWQVLYIASSYQMLAESVNVFNPSLFLAYRSSGYKNRDQGFWNKNKADLISFVHFTEVPSTLPEPVAPPAGPDFFSKEFHSFRSFYLHDISILFRANDMEIWEASLFKFIASRTAGLVVDVNEVLRLRSICPKSQLPNRIYRLCWQATNFPLSKILSNQLQNDLRSAITTYFADESVPLILS